MGEDRIESARNKSKTEQFVFPPIFLFCFQTSLPHLINFQFLFKSTSLNRDNKRNIFFNFLSKIISKNFFFQHKGTSRYLIDKSCFLRYNKCFNSNANPKSFIKKCRIYDNFFTVTYKCYIGNKGRFLL